MSSAARASVPAASVPAASSATASSELSPSATGATRVIAYNPYLDGVPRPGLTVSATDTATDCRGIPHDPWPLRCTSADGVPDPVYKIVTHPIYDPCFPTDDATSCLYVASPTSTTAVRVPLPAPEPGAVPTPPATWPGYSAATPWAIELTDGPVCVFSQGAEDNVGGLRPQDECSDGRYLFGEPDETGPVWNVRVGMSQSGPLSGSARIATVWIFGR